MARASKVQKDISDVPKFAEARDLLATNAATEAERPLALLGAADFISDIVADAIYDLVRKTVRQALSNKLVTVMMRGDPVLGTPRPKPLALDPATSAGEFVAAVHKLYNKERLASVPLPGESKATKRSKK